MDLKAKAANRTHRQSGEGRARATLQISPMAKVLQTLARAAQSTVIDCPLPHLGL
jgi:hypothetical protein